MTIEVSGKTDGWVAFGLNDKPRVMVYIQMLLFLMSALAFIAFVKSIISVISPYNYGKQARLSIFVVFVSCISYDIYSELIS